MAYSLLPTGGSVEAALHRVALEQLDPARAGLGAEGEALHPAVHDARKRLKKLRGLARLVRGAFPDYVRTNEALRDTGRLLSEVRDRTALIESLDRLGARGGRPGQEAARPLRDSLVEARQAALASEGLTERLAEARERLEALAQAVPGWRLEASGWKAVEPGLARTYGRARDVAEVVRKGPAPEAVHEWRKRLKDHWYHTRLLKELWPEAMIVRAEALSQLTELLGENHDLSVLRPHLSGPELAGEARETLLRLADRLSEQNQEAAGRLAGRLLADRPKALVRRWKVLWRLAEPA